MIERFFENHADNAVSCGYSLSTILDEISTGCFSISDVCKKACKFVALGQRNYAVLRHFLTFFSLNSDCGINFFSYLEKMKKYPDLGPKFKPLVIESTGGCHGYSMDNLKIMAGNIASRTNKPTSFALSNLLRTCSFPLQRHQGTMLARRCLGLA
jgi:hypothetical protein